MNIAAQLPYPLNSFSVDVPANQYYDFQLGPDSTYPLKGVTYPVDYGNIPGYTAEDGCELDFLIGMRFVNEIGYVLVNRGENLSNEHKFYIGLTEAQVQEVISQLKPVLIKAEKIDSVNALLHLIESFKGNQ